MTCRSRISEIYFTAPVQLISQSYSGIHSWITQSIEYINMQIKYENRIFYIFPLFNDSNILLKVKVWNSEGGYVYQLVLHANVGTIPNLYPECQY